MPRARIHDGRDGALPCSDPGSVRAANVDPMGPALVAENHRSSPCASPWPWSGSAPRPSGWPAEASPTRSTCRCGPCRGSSAGTWSPPRPSRSLGGRLGDVVGRTRTFLLGVGVFAAGALLAALVTGAERAHRGPRSCRGSARPSCCPPRSSSSPPTRRRPGPGAGFRMRGMVYAVSFGIGPLVGGVLTDYLSLAGDLLARAGPARGRRGADGPAAAGSVRPAPARHPRPGRRRAVVDRGPRPHRHRLRHRVVGMACPGRRSSRRWCWPRSSGRWCGSSREPPTRCCTAPCGATGSCSAPTWPPSPPRSACSASSTSSGCSPSRPPGSTRPPPAWPPPSRRSPLSIILFARFSELLARRLGYLGAGAHRARARRRRLRVAVDHDRGDDRGPADRPARAVRGRCRHRQRRPHRRGRAHRGPRPARRGGRHVEPQPVRRLGPGHRHRHLDLPLGGHRPAPDRPGVVARPRPTRWPSAARPSTTRWPSCARTSGPRSRPRPDPHGRGLRHDHARSPPS